MRKLLFLSTLFLSGCKEVELVGDVFCKIYPKDGYADCATVVEQKPDVKVTDPVEKPLSDLDGWIAVKESQFAKYRRAYESQNQSSEQPLEKVHEILQNKRQSDLLNQ